MKFLHFKVFAPLLIFFLSTACKPVYQSMLFDPKSLPEKPNYAASKSWAAFPGKYPLVLQTFEKTKKDNILSFKIAGTTLNVYEINIHLNSRKITCDCPDKCKQFNTSCKHECFILLKVLKILFGRVVNLKFVRKCIMVGT